MENYRDSDYALNKYSENIVYRFDNRIVEVTLADYLAENPDKTEQDFLVLKKSSDDIYLDQVRNENAQTKLNSSFDGAEKIALCYAQSPEDSLISEICAQEEDERQQQRLIIANCAMDKLTDVQRKRYLMYHVNGLTMRQIADKEGVGHTKIQKSLEGAEKKIKKVLSDNKPDSKK